MAIFWIMTGMVTALAGLWVLSFARRGAGDQSALSEVEADRLAGARELAELDRMKGLGLLDEAGWKSARAEAGRRILSARRAEAGVRVGSRDRHLVLGGLALTAALSLGLYLSLGRPGLPDQSYRQRVAEWAAKPEALEPAQVAAVLTEVVRENPDDGMALSMLGAARFEAGDPISAASAFRRALALNPNDGRNWARLGESLVRANNGEIAGDAEAAFIEAVKKDPDQLGARYFLGELALQRGDVAAARTQWGPLLAVLDPADPRRADLQTRLSEAGQ